MLTAHRAVRIFAKFEFTEFHCQRIKEQQAPDKILATTMNQFDRFHRLNRADDTRQHAKHAPFSARRH